MRQEQTPVNPKYQNTFDNAKAYELYVGRWSRLLAVQFLDWLNLPPGQRWLDVGAGTGVLSQAILDKASPAKILGIDLSADFLELAKQQVQDDRLEFRLEDAANLAFEAPQFDVAVAGLVLNFLASPETVIQKMREAVASGGTVAAYVWDYRGKMQMMSNFWEAAMVVDPAAHEQDARKSFGICEPDRLAALFESQGLKQVETLALDIPTRFRDFDDYWQPILAAQGSISRYLRSMNEATLNAVREQLQKQLPIAKDGSIHLEARAWAVKGVRGD